MKRLLFLILVVCAVPKGCQHNERPYVAPIYDQVARKET
jgi:hypothetical protein